MATKRKKIPHPDMREFIAKHKAARAPAYNTKVLLDKIAAHQLQTYKRRKARMVADAARRDAEAQQ